MDDMPAVKALEAAALKVRAEFDKRHGLTSAGNCRDVSIATALAYQFPGVSPVLTYGYVQVGAENHEHFWCRLNGWIVDPTADQFAKQPKVLVASEADLAHYKEKFFFHIHSDVVLRMAYPTGTHPFSRH